MRRITLDIWRHIPAGEQVESGYGYKLNAPDEAGTYTLYQIVDDKNCHQGWEWEQEQDSLADEDKKVITKKLLDLLKLTRAGKDLKDCEYYMEHQFCEEFVILRRKNRRSKAICVTADSGIALIKDVISVLEEG